MTPAIRAIARTSVAGFCCWRTFGLFRQHGHFAPRTGLALVHDKARNHSAPCALALRDTRRRSGFP